MRRQSESWNCCNFVLQVAANKSSLPMNSSYLKNSDATVRQLFMKSADARRFSSDTATERVNINTVEYQVSSDLAAVNQSRKRTSGFFGVIYDKDCLYFLVSRGLQFVYKEVRRADDPPTEWSAVSHSTSCASCDTVQQDFSFLLELVKWLSCLALWIFLEF